MFKPIFDFVYLKADTDLNRNIKLKNGKVLWIDGAFNPHATEHVCQEGEIRYVCRKLSENKHRLKKGLEPLKIEVKPGDYVFTHHFLTDEDQKVDVDGEKLYRLPYELVYCKLNGKIEMIGEFNLVEPLEKKQESKLIIMPFKKPEPLKGILRHTNKKMKELGAKEGDTVFYTKNSDYEMKIKGETFYRMENSDIIGVETN